MANLRINKSFWLKVLIFASCIFIFGCIVFLATTIPIDRSFTNSRQVGDLGKSASLISVNLSISSIKVNLIDLGSATAKVYVNSSAPSHSSEYLPSILTIIDGSNGNFFFNVLGQDQPIYLLPGSILVYSLQINNTGSSSCPIKLHLFNNDSMYFKFINGDSGSPLLSTPCIMESTKQPLNLIINESSVYYVAIQIAANVSVICNMSGTRVYYNTAGLTSPDDCKDLLSSVNPKCEIEICDEYLCNYNFDYIIVEVTGGSTMMDFTNIQRYWMDRNIRTVFFYIFIVCVIFYGLAMILFAIYCIFVVLFCDVTSPSTETMSLLLPSDRIIKPSSNKYKTYAISCVCVIDFFLIGISIICLGVAFIFHTQQPMDVNAVVPISNDVANYPILLDSDLYKYASSITFTFIGSSAEHIKLNFDEEPNTNNVTLHDNVSITAVNFTRQGLNYYRNDTPVNLAKGSNVTYKLNVTSSNGGSCVHLYLIYSADAYFMFINSTTNTTFNKHINRTDCLANGTSTFIFNITQLEGDYYVAYEAVNVSFTVEVNIIQVYYVPGQLNQSSNITSSQSYTKIYCWSFVCLYQPQLKSILMTRSNVSGEFGNVMINSSSSYFNFFFLIVPANIVIIIIILIVGSVLYFRKTPVPLPIPGVQSTPRPINEAPNLVTIANVEEVHDHGGTNIVEKGKEVDDGVFKKVILIESSTQGVLMNNYGLKIAVDPNSVKDGETSELTIKVNIKGDFQFPDGYEPVSAIYDISLSNPLLKPLMISMQHCVEIVSQSQTQFLKFFKAHGPSPYVFEEMKEGEFYENNYNGFIKLGSFCKFTTGAKVSCDSDYSSVSQNQHQGYSSVSQNQHQGYSSVSQNQHQGYSSISQNQHQAPRTITTSSLCYSAVVFQSKDEEEDKQIFTTAKDLDALKKYIKETYDKEDKQTKTYPYHFEDDSDSIKLSYDHDDDKDHPGWKVYFCTTPCQLTKKEINKFGFDKSDTIPKREVTIIKEADCTSPLYYPVSLSGIVEKIAINITRDYTKSTLPPINEQSINPTSSVSHRLSLTPGGQPRQNKDIRKKTPEQKDLLEILASISDKWNRISLALAIERSSIEEIRTKSDDNMIRLSEVLNAWFQTNDSVTWEKIIEAVRGPIVADHEKANEIENYLSRDDIFQKYCKM